MISKKYIRSCILQYLLLIKVKFLLFLLLFSLSASAHTANIYLALIEPNVDTRPSSLPSDNQTLIQGEIENYEYCYEKQNIKIRTQANLAKKIDYILNSEKNSNRKSIEVLEKQFNVKLSNSLNYKAKLKTKKSKALSVGFSVKLKKAKNDEYEINIDTQRLVSKDHQIMSVHEVFYEKVQFNKNEGIVILGLLCSLGGKIDNVQWISHDSHPVVRRLSQPKSEYDQRNFALFILPH